MEGLLVDRGIHFSHLKGTLEAFCRSFFGPDVSPALPPRLFPLYRTFGRSRHQLFPLFRAADAPTAGSARAAAGWRSWAAAWSIPRCLRNCGIDPEDYSGFAFGMGIERVAMVKYGVPDLRLLYENDLRLLDQFG